MLYIDSFIEIAPFVLCSVRRGLLPLLKSHLSSLSIRAISRMDCRSCRQCKPILVSGNMSGNMSGNIEDMNCLSGNSIPNSPCSLLQCRYSRLQRNLVLHNEHLCSYMFRHQRSLCRSTVMVHLPGSMAQNHQLVTPVLRSSSFVRLLFISRIE